jgi:hypothetical protein
MQGMVYLGSTTGLPATGLSVNGDLNMIQKQPLAHKGIDERFVSPIFNKSSAFADAFNFKDVLRDYADRNGTSIRYSRIRYLRT